MNSLYVKYGKRIIDCTIAIIVLIVFFPIMLVVALILAVTAHKPIYFIQQRIGWNERKFNLYKFKSMNDQRDALGKLLPDASRLTGFGKFIRKTSLDELPQLINVIKGDMSLVGPRPLLVSYLPLYSATQRKRHLVRPGITGWAQVNGRNTLSWQEKFEYDLWYVNHISLIVDIKILWRTLKYTISARGINQQGEATMQAFTGNNEV